MNERLSGDGTPGRESVKKANVSERTTDRGKAAVEGGRYYMRREASSFGPGDVGLIVIAGWGLKLSEDKLLQTIDAAVQ